jgi:hypothetical protein
MERNYKYFKSFSVGARMTQRDLQFALCRTQLKRPGDCLIYVNPLFWRNKLLGLRYSSEIIGRLDPPQCIAVLVLREK